MSDFEDNDLIDYGRLIDDAMHVIVKRVMQLIDAEGLPGEHHFYITFLTQFPGVMISDELESKYPEEMTIVIQHQYWELEVTDEYFSIVLSFNHKKQSLTVPYDAIISFADPSVKFGLQFRYAEEYLERMRAENPSLLDMDDEPGLLPKQDGLPDNDGDPDVSNVVSLDSFRKNKN